MNLPITALVLLGLGLLVAMVGGIMVLVAAFRQSLVWGLVALLVPLGNLVFTILHWTEAKKGTLLSLAGAALVGGAALMAQAELRIFAGKGGPLGLAIAGEPPAKDLTAQIADQRTQLETLSVVFAQDGTELAQQYGALEARRGALKPGDAAALAQFNADAALYQTRTTRRKEMLAEIATAQRDLDALLAKRALASASGGGAGAKKVVMYSTSRCPACQMAKQYFVQKGVSYQEIDVETSADGRAAFQKLGGRGVPLIMVGDKRVEGFSSQALDAML